MGYNKEGFLNMVNSGNGMLFAYDKKEDRLYLSSALQKELGTMPMVRSYWKDSENWNWIPQQDQEALVIALRHHIPEDNAYVYHVKVRCIKDREPVPYRLEIFVLRGEDGEILGVRGTMSRL